MQSTVQATMAAVSAAPPHLSLAHGALLVSGNCILSDVSERVFLTPAEHGNQGSFIGFHSDRGGSRVVFPIGKLKGLRILCLYRFKLWWMTQWMGNSAQDIPYETQFLMAEVPCSRRHHPNSTVYYTVFLPLLEGDFRAVLQGNANDELEICLESGDPSVEEFEGRHLVYVAVGLDPFNLIGDSIKYLEDHLQTFKHRDHKQMPDMLNWFGWCTWDAFYSDVSAEGVEEGVKCLVEGGAPPKFLIIDDGWQSVSMDVTGNEARIGDSANFANRLTDIRENKKFRKYGREFDCDAGAGFRQIVSGIKEKFCLKYIYIWHAIGGYWGGVHPGIDEMARYESKIVSVVPSPGIESNGVCFVLKSIIDNKVGLVNPNRIDDFYHDLHLYLASSGIDGVKVDNQSILETLGAGFGGRVKLAKKYHEALEKSVSENFKNNAMISCMSHSTDALYRGKKACVVRASDDFFPRDPASHTIHVASVAYNSIFLGEFMQPDWDMFHSLHPMAEYHAAARAVGGCPIYVSDKPGNHDFDVLKKLVLPDGSTLRAKLPGRPTIDCLFSDPTSDGKSLLKIWNMNDYTGVVGVFNCQGASWCRTAVRNMIHDEQPETISGTVEATDVHYLSSVADDDGWRGDCIVYSYRGGKVEYLPAKTSVMVQLKAREFEVFTVVPVKQLSNGAAFAPIGLVKMFNPGGAIKQLKYESEAEGIVGMRVRGCGEFAAYSTARPKRIGSDGEMKEIEFDYEAKSGLITANLAVHEEVLEWDLTIEF
ncbi:probable galactinol--sucrose galactosyltransferase 1 isoform X2 [Andrographis paniculata]|uniref:probable galactinol--sucrose galactosyltransferase 1 isoform X2 n=1 Tax=Andrographis paniculata TaxID=175694 RepID=UPI0021E82CF5|nr:probable galactinol--sucrose galactosyltransferase 1 isoform X2 [Andrographis paniculata]